MRQSTCILLGCVSQKGDHPARAKDLYRSQLWKRRREFAEASGRPWMILSALHGLVDPQQMLAPYDLALASLSAADRRRWGKRVVERLALRFGTLDGSLVEVHAGAPYRNAIAPPLERLGAGLDAPLSHLGLGRQLAWYGAR